MGHKASKDLYRELVGKLDGSTVRMPDHTALRALLEELYRPEEAELVSRMPWGLSCLSRVSANTRLDEGELLPRLGALADKGLVLDLMRGDTKARYFMPSPFVIGIFEFAMMRAGVRADHARRAKLFHDYLERGDFFRANLGNAQQVFVARALPHWDTIESGTEILTCDNVESIVEQSTRFGVGICSCRHEQEHLTTRKCKMPLETCTVLGASADYLIRHQMARPIERAEMREILARSRDSGLVLSADNVKEGIGFICHCCSCCCNLVRGITERGYSNAISTAPYVPSSEESKCDSCGRCV